MNILNSTTTPFYKKLTFILVSLLIAGYIAIIAKELLCPLLFSMLFSIVLLPIASFLEKKLHFPRSLSSFSTLVLFIGSLFLIFYLLGSQISNLMEDWPLFKTQLYSSLESLQVWIAGEYHINAHKQIKYLNQATTEVMSSGGTILSSTIHSLSSVVLFLVFTMIDVFFLLLYRRHILRFLVAVFKEEHARVVYAIVAQVQLIIRKFIIGLLIELTIVTVIVCIAFVVLGIKYGILLGLLTGILNLIPYLGIFTALIISLLITFATAASTAKVLIVAVVIFVVHLLDSNILLPIVVGSKVKINALMAVIGVFIGEMIWGIPGMFLSIPVLAVMKVIFDRIESLQPWGILLGEESKENPITVSKL